MLSGLSRCFGVAYCLWYGLLSVFEELRFSGAFRIFTVNKNNLIMAGWLADLKKKNQAKRGLPSSFVIHEKTDSVFLIIGASFDMSTGVLAYRMIGHGATVPTVVSEEDLKLNYRFAGVR